MTLDQFSTILVVSSIALFLFSVGIFIMSHILTRVRLHLEQHSYRQYLYALLAVSIISIIGTLIFQLVYLTPVCELCWWQRIFLYPIPIIAAVALWFHSKESHLTIGILAALGLWYASYHYYYHFRKFVLGDELSLPCSYGGLMPACTDSPILIFGFATIPFLGIMVFASILVIAFFAHRVKEKK